MYDRVPEGLRSLRQWVCHRFPDKAPLCPFPDERGDLTFASCNKPETWGSFEAAVKAVSLGWAKGIGIEFANGIAGIDIDHCVDGGELSELAREIVETFRSYTEISPSGTGVHILFRGKLPGTGCKLPMLGLEVYDSGRYFTVTGNAYLDPDGDAYPLRDCTEELGAFYKRYFDNTLSEETKLQVKSTASPADAQKRAASTQRHLKLLSAIQETLGKAGTMMAENAGAPEAWRLFGQVQAGLGYLMDMIQQDASEVR